jgi:hypothetical protein
MISVNAVSLSVLGCLSEHYWRVLLSGVVSGSAWLFAVGCCGGRASRAVLIHVDALMVLAVVFALAGREGPVSG